ncbi:hypothetical protein [Zavarzinella formosa]|uniref:hypothetical protein n=1 Tax=Zavarzinella formosa TaxID=360055 RepID=UPI000307DA51|nr:hypothetical protein [Zavarzinella formosa]
MSSPASLLSSLIADYAVPPSFVDKTYGEPLFHTDSEVVALRYAPDDTLWTMEEAGILRHWTSDGRLIDRDFLSDTEDVWVFNADASLVASGTNEIALWSTGKAKELVRHTGESWANCLAFSPVASILASGHDDGMVKLWKLPKLELIAEFTAHKDAVSSIAFSADGRELTTAGDDHLIHGWDLTSKKQIREWRGHTDRVPAMAWHPAGEFLISVGWDTTARVWEPSRDDATMLLNAHSDQVNTLAFSPTGHLLACSDSDFTIHLWGDPRHAAAHFALRGHTDDIRALAFNASGTRLASAGADRVVHIWDTATGRLVAGPNPSARHGVVLNGHTLFSTAGSQLQAWNTETSQRDWPASVTGDANELSVSPNGKWLVTSGATPDATLWDIAAKKPAATLSHTKGPIGSPTFSANSELIATASRSDGLMWLWKVGVPEAILVIPEAADNSTLEAIAFHPNNKFVAIGGLDWLSTSGTDGALCVWDLEARDKHLTIEAGVTALAFDYTGLYLAAGIYSQKGVSVGVWNFDTQEKLFELPGHHDRVNAVAFSPDGSWLVSASDDCTIRVWNVLTGRLTVARQFDAAIQTLAFSPDGKYLYTGNANTTASRLSMKRLLED